MHIARSRDITFSGANDWCREVLQLFGAEVDNEFDNGAFARA